MKKIIFSILIIIAIISSFCFVNFNNNKSQNIETSLTEPIDSLLAVRTKPNINRKATPEFVQAIYLTAYTVANNRFDIILQKAKIAGINTIVFDVKEMQGYVHLPIKDNPKIKYLSQENIWDIEDIVKKIHSYDMVAVARIVQFFNIETAKKHTDLLIQNKEGGYWSENSRRPMWLDPSNPEVQNDLIELVDMLGQTNVDEIQLDYVRFPTEGRLSNASFYFQREDAIKAQTDSSYIKREKKDIITGFLKDLDEVCKFNEVRLTADVFAIVAWQRNIDIRNTGQDIAMMTPYLSQFHPMIYSSHFNRDFNNRLDDIYNKPYSIVKEGLELAIKKSDPNCLVIPYLQAFNWKVFYDKQYMFDQLRATVDAGCKGYILWNAGNAYDRTLNWIREWNFPNEYQAPPDPPRIKKPKKDSLDKETKVDSFNIATVADSTRVSLPIKIDSVFVEPEIVDIDSTDTLLEKAKADSVEVEIKKGSSIKNLKRN